MGAARIIVGAALLVLIAVVGERARLGAGHRRLVAASGVFVAVYQASFFTAVAKTGVAVGTVVALGPAPAFTGLLARVFTGERLKRRWLAATGLACAGVCLITLGGGGGRDISAPGVALALAAGAGYAGYAVAGKRLMDDGATPEGLMAAVFSACALILTPVLLFVPVDGLATPEGAALALYLGALPTALERIGASETSTLTLAEPVTAMLLGFVVLSERPGAIPLLGAALVLAGLGVLAGRVAPTWRRQSQPSEPRIRPRPKSSQATSLSASG